MKGGVTRGLLTKDVRSADGWQIVIDVFEHVQVTAVLRYSSIGRDTDNLCTCTTFSSRLVAGSHFVFAAWWVRRK